MNMLNQAKFDVKWADKAQQEIGVGFHKEIRITRPYIGTKVYLLRIKQS